MSGVRLEPWAKGDLPLVERLMGDAAMTEHLGRRLDFFAGSA